MHEARRTDLDNLSFADDNEGTNDTPCILSRSNFDLAEHAFSSSTLDAVKNNVDFAVIKDAMATFQKAYVDQTVEIPLYYRKNVELANEKVGNYFANGTQVGSTWNGEDWFVRQ